MPKTYLITGATGIGTETARAAFPGLEAMRIGVQRFIAAREEDQCERRSLKSCAI